MDAINSAIKTVLPYIIGIFLVIFSYILIWGPVTSIEIGNVTIVERKKWGELIEFKVYTDKGYNFSVKHYPPVEGSQSTFVIGFDEKGRYINIRDWAVFYQLPDSVKANPFK